MTRWTIALGVWFAAAGCTSTTTTIGGDADPGPDITPEVEPDVLPDATETCLPSDDVGVEWYIDGSVMDDVHISDLPCTTTAVTEIEEGVEIDLLCGTGGIMEEHVIDVAGDPYVWTGLWDGEEVMLSYISEPFRWTHRWFVLRDTWGGIRLAGIDADAVVPHGTSSWEWYDPIDVRPLGGLCEPVDEPPGCGIYERQALEVGLWDGRAVVFDGTHEWAGFMETVSIHVGQAWRYTETRCEDVPGSWYSAVFVFHMEG